MGGFKDDGGGAVVDVSFGPAGDTKAPLIAVFETRELILRAWCGEVVAKSLGKYKELFGDSDTDGVEAAVFGASMAVAVTVESCDGI